MVLAQLVEYFSTSPTPPLRDSNNVAPGRNASVATRAEAHHAEEVLEEEEKQHPLVHAGLAGGLGGVTGDMLMHSLDTVKTRQQGDPYRPPKYHSLGNTYYTILRQEGFARGLYGGVLPAFVGSFGGTFIFFGTYEWSKRLLKDNGVTPAISYFTAGLIADVAASPLYVPTEVLKTRLQLQGRYNNPYFKSGYNYRSTLNAASNIARHEGIPALFHGYRATLYRDLPFSALQFAFYEKEREAAMWFEGTKNLSLPTEIFVGATAGGAAGVITCPFDVVKTRMQTQVNGATAAASTAPTATGESPPLPNSSRIMTTSQQCRSISTAEPPTKHRKAGASTTLNTASVMKGLRIIYQTEGIMGWFRGVGPRGVWTSIQSGTMLVLYQILLGKLEEYPIVKD
ncbi:MAG: hypothetical protein Q9162_002299 [Coniocarpon cinnabarinum]